MKKKDYLSYMQKAVKEGRETYEDSIEKWKENFDVDYMFGYTSPGNIASQIHMEAVLYSINGGDEHLEFIKRGLVEPLELSSIFPEEVRVQRKEYYRGVPLLEPLFQLHAYLNAYFVAKEAGVLTEKEENIVRQSIIQSITPLNFCPEWGAHNRSMLRACALVQAAAALGDDEETREWIKLADYLAEESMGRWSIEDAAHYIPLWLFACIMYAKWRGVEDEYYNKPHTRYYFEYAASLITPEGQMPGFGDTWFHSNWHIWTACMEMGATKYKSSKMKMAAEKMYEFGMKKNNNVFTPGLGNYMAYAYKWSSDEVETAPIEQKSEEVLDELVGKKIILRGNGSYMLYNYRDEGMYSYIPRQYLRTSIPVKAEKMHHGQADENSISHMEKDGNILLHESGYRERLPNGKYRADLYHNKLIFRSGKADFKQGNFNALHDDGYYKHVDTEKLHFQCFPEVEYLRTRNHYKPLNLTWDRAVTWLKNEDAYIVVDWVQANENCDVTIGNVWHSQNAIVVEDGIYETNIDTIQRGQNDKDPYENKKDYSLLIEFLSGDTIKGTDEIMRNHGDATMVSECISEQMKKDDTKVFITVLTPHNRKDDCKKLSGRLKARFTMDNQKALMLEYEGVEKTLLTYKLDLQYGLNPYEDDRAPAYDWDSGKINYGEITTDADFSYISITDEACMYGLLNGCRVYYKDKNVFEAPRYTSRDFLLEKFMEIDHKWRVWNGEFKNNEKENCK